jgi:hypothetical protein
LLASIIGIVKTIWFFCVKLISKITIIIKNGGKGRNKTKVLARTAITTTMASLSICLWLWKKKGLK